MSQEIRKESVIIFADIVGYTALMQKDESRTLNLLESFKTTIHNVVPKFDGTIVQYFGDACLLAFSEELSAVNCVVELQLEFIRENVPVRIGMHSGEVVFKENNAFGDVVNIASRIETMGVQGSVLLSKSIFNQLQPHSELNFTSLGHFGFKNVQQEMEVFALAHPELIVPHRKDLVGKFKEKNSFNYLPTFLVGLLIIAIIGWFNFSKTDTISEKNLERKVAINVFENQTDREELNPFGTMISDWVTNLLIKSGAPNIINIANLQSNLSSAGLQQLPNPELTADTGIELIINGRYYTIENQFIVIGNLVNIATGKVVRTFEKKMPVEGDMSSILQAFSQEVLDYWNVKDLKRFSSKPPKYESYQDYLTGLAYSNSNPEFAKEKYLNAFRNDTTFYAPLFSLLGKYESEAKDSLLQSTLKFMESKKESFTEWESMRYQEWQAIHLQKWSEAARLAEKRYSYDSTDYTAINVAATCYGRANEPQKMLDIYKSFDPRYFPEQKELSWKYANFIFANLQLENFSAVDSIAESYSRAKIPDGVAAMHLIALANTNDSARIIEKFEYYIESGSYNTSGNKSDHSFLAKLLSGELYLQDKQSILASLIPRLEAIAEEEQNDNLKGYIALYKGLYDQVIHFWNEEEIATSNLPGWIKKNIEYEHASRLGVAYALAKDYDRAEKQLKFLNNEAGKSENKVVEAAYYYPARIWAYLGKQGAAIDALIQAKRKGFHFHGPARYNHDPFLKPLKDNPDFISLVTPK